MRELHIGLLECYERISMMFVTYDYSQFRGSHANVTPVIFSSESFNVILQQLMYYYLYALFGKFSIHRLLT